MMAVMKTLSFFGARAATCAAVFLALSSLPAKDKTAPPTVGEPVSLKFSAVKGRVDLETLKGKVVLIDFWATWCGPCVKEVPNVVAAYEKLHDKGFEIVGISLDQDRAALMKFTKDHKMTWPQYFDGKGWDNMIAKRFHIQAIPAMWLLDKEGKLASTNVRGNLEAEVEKLLAK